eukprot:jgi/Mesvir1/21769/Mv04170-RA.2
MGSVATLLDRLVRVGTPFLFGSSKWRARLMVGAMVGLCVITTGMFVILSYIQRDMSTALAEKDASGFYRSVVHFVGIVLVATPLFAVYDYTQDRLALDWRYWMTKELTDAYFSRRSYFALKMDLTLDNPDERITEDVRAFVAGCVGVVTVVVGHVLNATAFIAVLWRESRGAVVFLWVYAVLGTYITVRVFGAKLAGLKAEGLQREANFRYSLIRVRENAESIAFFRGDRWEAESTHAFMAALVQNILARLRWGFGLNLWTNAYDYATLLIPSLLMAPRYFAGEVEFGVIAQTGIAFRTIMGAMAVVISNFQTLSSLVAESERLDKLIVSLGLWPRSQRSSATPRHGGRRRWPSRWHPFRSKPISASSAAGNGDDDDDAASTNDVADNVEMASSSAPLLGSDSVQRKGRRTSEVVTLSRANESLGDAAGDKDGKIEYKYQERGGLVLQRLSVAVPNMKQPATFILNDLDLEVPPGTSLLIMGPSGCGKSTLMRAVATLWDRGSGTITLPPVENTFFLPQSP